MNRIGELLAQRNMSQKELAITLGLAQPSVSAWVKNKSDPTITNAQRIANLFNVSIDYLLCVEKDELDTPPTWGVEYPAGVAFRTQKPRDLSGADLDAIAKKVKAMIGATNNLTPYEQELVDDFRLLNNAQKHRIRAMIAGYLDAKYSEEE